MFHRIIKINQNKNCVKKINHEYFGGSDVTNVQKQKGKLATNRFFMWGVVAAKVI